MAGTGEGRSAGALFMGARVRWQEREWEVMEWQGSQVTLVPRDGTEAPRVVSYRWLVGAEDFAVLGAGGATVANGRAVEGWGRQEGRKEEAALWQARMVEIDTGLAPGRSEHERGFGPGTTLAQRCAAMSARLAADGIRCSAHPRDARVPAPQLPSKASDPDSSQTSTTPANVGVDGGAACRASSAANGAVTATAESEIRAGLGTANHPNNEKPGASRRETRRM